MLPKLPDKFEIRRGADGGDSFFHAVAQSLKHLKPGEACSVKTLRLACKRYAITHQEEVRSWLNAALENDAETRNIEDYVKYVEFTAKELATKKAVSLKVEKSILGRPEIEGRMICNIYHVRLHVIEKYVFDGNNGFDQMPDKSSPDCQPFASCLESKFGNNENMIWKSKLVDKNGCNLVEKVDYDANDTIYLLQPDKHIFQPILKQNCEDICSDSSDDDEVGRSLAYKLRIEVQSTKSTEEKINLIRELLEKGADIDFQDCNDKGNTILHIAIRQKDFRIVKLFVENGADIFIENKNGFSACQYAIKVKCPKIIYVLIGKWDCLNINQDKHVQDVPRTTVKIKSNMIDNIPNVPKFRRRSDDDGVSGQRYEVDLLILFNLRGEHLTNDFYLGGNLKEGEDFDDVVFKYWDKYGSRTIFLQAKHKQNPTHHQISLGTFSTDKDFYLEKYFKSYLKITETFKKKISNPIFQEGFQNAKCDFVIFTNAFLDESCDSFILQETRVGDFPIGIGGRVIKLKPECALDCLTKKERAKYVGLLSNTFIEFLSKANKHGMMESNELVKEYHVIWAQRVLKDKVEFDANNGPPGNKGKKYRNTVFREEFLNGTSKDIIFSQFRDEVLKNLKFQKYRKETVQVPVEFGNVGAALHLSHSVEKFCDKFMQLIIGNFSCNVCKVYDISDRKFLKDMCKLVGRVLTLNSITGFLRLNDATLEGESKVLRDSLSNAMTCTGFELQMDFDFQMSCFPKLALRYQSKYETADMIDFINKLYIFTGQPSVIGMDELIKQELKDYYKLTNDEAYQSYLRISDQMTKYWMKTEKVDFLRKGDGLFRDIIRNSIHFRLRYPVPSFTGREKELKILHESLQKDQLVAISGLGGIGKSELARKYVAMYGSCYDNNIIWINAETVATASYSFRTLCLDVLNIPVTNEDGRERDNKLIVKDVFGFFHKRRSLFIFDNATSYKNLSYDPENGIKNFLPKQLSPGTCNPYNPCIIITSRNENWPTENIISLPTFSDEEAIDFVKSFLQITGDSEDEDITELIKCLQNFPLALQQAVSYIREYTDPRFFTNEFNIADYLKLCKERKPDMLNFKFPEDSIDSYTTTTYMTWNITIESVRLLKFGTEAILLMSLLAYLDPNGIGIEFFSATLLIKQKAFKRAINLLKQYSLITLHDESVSVHRLVQEVTRINLKTQAMEKFVLSVALSLVAFHTENVHIVHGLSVWNFAKHNHDLVGKFNMIPSKIAIALKNIERNNEAYSLTSESSILLNSLLGPDHLGTIANQSAVSYLLIWQGSYKEALEHCIDIHERLCKILGDDHPSALTARENIAVVLFNQGKHDEALNIYTEIFQKRANLLGPDHQSTLTIRHCIGLALAKLSKYEEALEVFLDVLDKKNVTLGPDDPSTLITRGTIAGVYSDQGKIGNALKMYLEIAEKENKILSPDNTSTLNTRTSIAMLYHEMGNHDEALRLLSEIIEIQNKVMGPDNRYTLSTQHNIAFALSKQGNYSESLTQYFKTFAKEVELFGPLNPSTLETERGIANVLMNQGKLEDALTAFSEVSDKLNKIHGPDNRSTLLNKLDISLVLSKQGRHDDALTSYMEVFQKQVKTLEPNNLDILATQNRIADVLFKKGKYNDALRYYVQSFKTCVKILGRDHPSTLSTEHGIAKVLALQGRHDKALKLLFKVFDKQVKILGQHHPSTLQTQHSIARVLFENGNYDEALKRYLEVFDLEQRILGPDDPGTVSTQHGIACIYAQQGKYEDALKMYLEVFDKLSAMHGPENPDILAVKFNIAEVLSKQGKHNEALKFYSQPFEQRRSLSLTTCLRYILVSVLDLSYIFSAKLVKLSKWFIRFLRSWL